MKNIKRTYNPTVRLSKFTLNRKIYEELERFLCNLIWRETLFHNNLSWVVKGERWILLIVWTIWGSGCMRSLTNTFSQPREWFWFKGFKKKKNSFRYLALTKGTPLASLSIVAIYPSVYESALLKSKVLLKQSPPNLLVLA